MQGKIYVTRDADLWFDRNEGSNVNFFTKYLIELFSKKELRNMPFAEFGIGRCNNIDYLSNFVKRIDGYDGSKKSLDMLEVLKNKSKKIDGKLVNLGESFIPLNKYDVVIFGFFIYMLTDRELDNVINVAKKALNKDGYIFIYDFLVVNNTSSVDIHNNNLKVFKRNFQFYLEKFKDFFLIDFRLNDNRNLHEYSNKDIIMNIDSFLEYNDYNWTFSALFKMKDINNDSEF